MPKIICDQNMVLGNKYKCLIREILDYPTKAEIFLYEAGGAKALYYYF